MNCPKLFSLAKLVLLISLGLSSLLHANTNQITIATFNVEWLGYPQNSGTWNGSRDSQLDRAADEILALNADIIALQEVIVDDLNGNALSDLLLKLNAKDQTDSWGGVVNNRFSFWWAPDFENFPAQRQAFILRRSKVQYVSAQSPLGWIPAGDTRFGSGRLPLLLQVTVNLGDYRVPLYLINLHLKCCSGSDDRRNDSMTALIEDLHTNYADQPIVILGDFNVADRGGAMGEIAEWGFYADDDSDGIADYFHGAGSVVDASWDDIDHIMLSDELNDSYLSTPQTDRNLKVSSTVSDHDPILTKLTWPVEEPADYGLVWADEFDQPDGSAPDPENWAYETGGWGWGNQEEQYYTDSTENVRIENGQLVIEVRKDTDNTYPFNDYTSGRIRTKDKHEWTHGRIEARIRLPFGDASGLWPAFWMLGADIDEVGWPNCGEIDIMEYISRKPNEVFGTIHGPGYFGGNAFGSIYDFSTAVAPPEPPALADPYDPQNYHVYAVEWENDRIRWYIDDILYHEATPEDVAPNDWVFNHDHFIILNLAIGGVFGGTIDAANLVFPTQMLVDYVRVYSMNTNPGMGLTKTGTFNDENNNGFAEVGETIDYTFEVENTGNVSLTNIVVSDPTVTVSAHNSNPQNILTNGDFESGGSSGWNTGGTVVTTYAKSGTHALQISSTGGFSSPSAFQTLPAKPGDEFNFSGFIYTSQTLPADTTFGLFKIVFQNSSGDELVPTSVSVGQVNSDFPGAESRPLLDASSPTGSWIFSEVQAVAPRGTASVLFFAFNIDQSPATLYFDSIKAIHLNQAVTLNLEPGETDSSTFSASYSLTETDINDGWVHNTALAACDQIDGVSAQASTHLPVNSKSDTDGDDFTDLFERAFGLDIFTPDPDSNRAKVRIVPGAGENHLEMNYRRRKGGSGTAGVNYKADGILYKVEVSDNLQTWQSGPLQIEEVGTPVDNGDGTENVTIRSAAPLGDAPRYIRLVISDAP